MYVIMDMGTTNTRLYLWENGQPADSVKGPFGAAFGKKYGRPELLLRVKELLTGLLSKCAAEEQDVECIVAAGMAGSEIGLCEVPHIPIPTDARVLAKNIRREKLKGIDIPFLFIPGVKKTDGEALADMMRGEEVETVGLASLLPLAVDGIFLLPGTHNKIVHVNRAGEIVDFCSTFSGELLDSLISHTILSGQASHDFRIIAREVRRGAAYAQENGLNAAAYQVRVMAKNGRGMDDTSSFLYGAVLGQDIPLIRRAAQGKTVCIAGRKALREVYAILLGEGNALSPEDEVCAQMMVRGAARIKDLYDSM